MAQLCEIDVGEVSRHRVQAAARDGECWPVVLGSNLDLKSHTSCHLEDLGLAQPVCV